jgi:osmotically inducible lipoprotein OsmB
MKRVLRVLTVLLLAGAISGCAGMTDTQQRVLSGGAIGAGAGAAVGILSGGSGSTGAIIGGAAGAAGGYIVDQSEKKRGR